MNLHKLSKTEAETARHYYDILCQRRWWKNGKGEIMRRRDMNINYKLNALAYIIREADRIVYDYAMDNNFICAPDCVQAELDAMMTDAAAHIIQTPMAQALLRDIMEYADVTPETLGLKRVNVRSSLSYPGAYLPSEPILSDVVWLAAR